MCHLTNQSLIAKRPWLLLLGASILVGIISGLGGMLLILLLHFIQHIAYGYSLNIIGGPETFLQGVAAASGMRRFLALILCGVVAGTGWWIIYRYGKPLVNIADAVKAKKPTMPVISTVMDALLQIITVGLGSPLGRELAPRELGATFACWLCTKIGLGTKESQIIVACSAGAGLAAVYNVPLGGVLFILETLLRKLTWPTLLPALISCSVATVVSWIGLGDRIQFALPTFSLTYDITIWAIIFAPFFGYAAYWFSRSVNTARCKAPKNQLLLLFCLINYTIIGVLAIQYPALLGNGHSVTQLSIMDNLSTSMAMLFLLLRSLIVWSSFRAGAQGGMLMPSIANGALMAVIFGTLWSYFFPGNSIGAFAIIGSAAFLASSQKMPLTAIVIIFEFTHVNFSFLVPILFAVAGSMSIVYICKQKEKIRSCE